MTDLLVRGCDILRVEEGQVRVDLAQDIAISGARIQAVGPGGSLALDGAPAVVEAAGLLAVPGLVNTHAHVPMVLFRGLVEDVTIDAWFNEYVFPMESNLTPEDVYWGALLGMAEMIESGVTTVADHYFFMDQVAEAVRDSGMRANLVWAVFGHEGPEKLDAPAGFVRRWQGGAEGRVGRRPAGRRAQRLEAGEGHRFGVRFNRRARGGAKAASREGGCAHGIRQTAGCCNPRPLHGCGVRRRARNLRKKEARQGSVTPAALRRSGDALLLRKRAVLAGCPKWLSRCPNGNGAARRLRGLPQRFTRLTRRAGSIPFRRARRGSFSCGLSSRESIRRRGRRCVG
jgi:hypothetical protein